MNGLLLRERVRYSVFCVSSFWKEGARFSNSKKLTKLPILSNIADFQNVSDCGSVVSRVVLQSEDRWFDPQLCEPISMCEDTDVQVEP